MKRLFICGAIALGLDISNGFAQEKKQDKTPTPPVPGGAPATTPTTPAPAAKEVAIIKTSLGEMVLEFWPDVAPKHVENFKSLAKKGFYNGSAFHRVIPGFMIQGGDPNTKDDTKKETWGRGGPGYTIKAEFNDRKHVRGVLSMARTPAGPDTAGCQFFICLAPAPNLDNQYTTFGKLIKGDEVLAKIGATPTEGPDRPVTRVNIDSINIVGADTIK